LTDNSDQVIIHREMKKKIDLYVFVLVLIFPFISALKCIGIIIITLVTDFPRKEKYFLAIYFVLLEFIYVRC